MTDQVKTEKVAPGVVIGVDIGGTGIKGAPADINEGRFAAERVRLATPSPATPRAVVDVVGEILQQIGVGGPVGVTVPAVVRRGVVETAAHIDQSWIGVDAVELFSKATGRPVAVMNDADAAGIAEVRFGAGHGHDGVVAVVTLGTGIGSALFADGTLVPNSELGHLPLHPGAAEDWAAESVREDDDLSWEIRPPVAGLPGRGSGRALARPDHHRRRCQQEGRQVLPRIELHTPVVPAQLHNDAGIIGAALSAPKE